MKVPPAGGRLKIGVGPKSEVPPDQDLRRLHEGGVCI
jgi:hypothetical protein